MSKASKVSRGAALLSLLMLGACVTAPRPAPSPRHARGGVSFIEPRCAGAQSCLLGHVTAAESGAPLERAAIFLQAEAASAPSSGGGPPGYLVAITDEQGVFTIVDPPTGSYRMAVYSNSRRVEVSGLELGSAGTTVVPVRLPQS